MQNIGTQIRRRLEPAQLVMLLYAAAILMGALLLLMPLSHGKPLSFIDALFMSASAITCTGLAPLNPAEVFTFFGQIIIMLLIQLGGLGIMTISSVFAIMLGRAVSMRDSGVFYDTFSVSHEIDLKKLMKAVILLMLAFEAVGTIILTLNWIPAMGWRKAFFAGLFHSVAAFCNAGLSTFPNALIGMEKDPVADLTIGLLIILGGLGFITITEIYQRRGDLVPSKLRALVEKPGSPPKPRRSWTLQTRMVLVYSAMLLGLGTLAYFTFELNNTLAGKPLHEQLLVSFFHSASARTAGFQNVDFALLNNTTLNMVIILMFIGTGPGSTGGGIKVTTFAIISALAVSRMRGFESVRVANRTIPEQNISRGIAITALAIGLLLAFITLLLISEEAAGGGTRHSHGQFLEIIFEAVSAFGTVGYSMGLTPALTATGKILIILLMMIGKLGPITVALAVTARGRKSAYQLCEESVMVG